MLLCLGSGYGGGRGSGRGSDPELVGVNSHALRTVVGLVDPDETVRQLKHVVTKTDDDELGVLRTFLKLKMENAL